MIAGYKEHACATREHQEGSVLCKHHALFPKRHGPSYEAFFLAHGRGIVGILKDEERAERREEGSGDGKVEGDAFEPFVSDLLESLGYELAG